MIDGRAESAERWSAKVRDWLRRYGVAECAGVTCALVASVIVRHFTSSTVAAAYAGAWGESIGYTSAIILRDSRSALAAARAADRAAGIGDAGRVATGLLAEFGPAAILDTLVVRPFAMATGMHFLGPTRGLIAGKLGADALFYLPVIFMYERRKRIERLRDDGA